MEDLHLSETETRYFGDLFLCCDEKSNEKIQILKATELFRSSNIPDDVLNKIMEISVEPFNHATLDYLNRKQFYSALKLIAAHQSNMALKPELLTKSLDLPLPKFTWALNSEANSDLILLSSSPKQNHMPKRDRKVVGNVLAYEPMRLSSNLSDSDAPPVSNDATDGLSTDSELESETLSQRSGTRVRRTKADSPWSTTSDSPTPTNSVAERSHPVWEASATGRGVWPASTAEEHTQLLGTEEESSDRHSSEEEAEAEDRWAMSDAQARHYAAQFAQLRPEQGLLPGHTAKLFFEKSRLSLIDLRKIWQLADITKDGMLTLEEFSIAMHLIVLRRNNMPVPDVLPPCLIPKVDSSFSQQAVTTDLVDLGADMFSSGTSADFNFTKPEDPYEGKLKKDERQKSVSPPKPEHQPNNKEWTKFVDSPTSSLSSPGPKPVNFDFHKSAVERDPKIYHPVALRVTPDASAMPTHGDGDVRSSVSPRRDDIAHAFELASPKRLHSQPPTEPPPNGSNPEIKSIQRPQPKKVVKAGVLPPPPAREPSHEEGPPSLPPLTAPSVTPLTAPSLAPLTAPSLAPRKEPPPPPPPRPRHHARSSSLDLNRFKGAAPPPQPPPRISPSAIPSSSGVTTSRRLLNQRSEGEPAFPPDAFPSTSGVSTSNMRLLHQRSEGEPAFPPDTFAMRDEACGFSKEDTPVMHGAFEVYRKPLRESSCDTVPDIKSLQEQNAVLHRVCRALYHELAELQKEKEALLVKLESHSTSV